MLCQFIFKNFYSYKNETVFDMQSENSISTENSAFGEALLQGTNNKRFLPVSVVYGPNGGGKSNLLKALGFVIGTVVKPIMLLKDYNYEFANVEFAPFIFDETSKNEPTEFTLFFRPNDEFEYKYFISLAKEKILAECLYRKRTKSSSKTMTLFERTENGITLGASIKKANMNTNVNEKMPYISFLHINYIIESINTAVDWFRRCVVRNYANYYIENYFMLPGDESLKNKVITLMNDAGINISGFIFEKNSRDENDDSIDILLEHTVYSKKYFLNLKYESDGTQKLFNIIPYVIIALTEGGLLVVDELDAKLHPKLLKFIIMLFKNPEINKNKAQLIFTSHDISTMKSSVFRTDEIWFACKLEDESSDLYSLYEIRDENGNHIQPSAAFDKQYLEGRYGADPYFRNMMDWE